jgi:hypothetical protein
MRNPSGALGYAAVEGSISRMIASMSSGSVFFGRYTSRTPVSGTSLLSTMLKAAAGSAFLALPNCDEENRRSGHASVG